MDTPRFFSSPLVLIAAHELRSPREEMERNRGSKALSQLRDREFKAGRYSPVILLPDFDDPTFFERHPGPQHDSIEEAVAASEPDGTCSILDISRIGDRPGSGVAVPLDAKTIAERYGTDMPTREQVMKPTNRRFLFRDLKRGHCISSPVRERKAHRGLLRGLFVRLRG